MSLQDKSWMWSNDFLNIFIQFRNLLFLVQQMKIMCESLRYF